MKKTISITNCKRPIELPIDNYLAHKDVVDHWCAGGEVEYCQGLSWTTKRDDLLFLADSQYRIKQREPQPGEVWIIDQTPYLIHELDGDLQSLNGKSYCCDGHTHLAYAAPSVEAYMARKFLKTQPGGPADVRAYSLWDDVTNAAQLETDND